MTKMGRILAIALLTATVATPVAGESPLEGRWLLVAESYGSGQSNRAPLTQPFRLEFFREGPRLAGRVWFGDAKAQAVPWPSLGLVPLDADEVVVGPGEDRVSVRYRARHAGDETVLEITEEYRVTSGGATLLGTVTVALLRGTEPAGSYVLERRFRREP